MVRNNLSNKINRIGALMEMLVENSTTYQIAKGDSCWVCAGTTFPKNSNISKTALKNQIVTLRNELLLLENLL